MKVSDTAFNDLKLGQLVASPYGNGTIFELFTMDDQNMVAIVLDNTKVIRVNHKFSYVYEIIEKE